jgi:hypothetical protein
VLPASWEGVEIKTYVQTGKFRLVLDSAGQIVAGDAAQPSSDEAASVELTLPFTGTYTLLITHLAAANGPARVTVELKPQTEEIGSSPA